MKCPTCKGRGYVSKPVSFGGKTPVSMWVACPDKCPASVRWLEKGA